MGDFDKNFNEKVYFSCFERTFPPLYVVKEGFTDVLVFKAEIAQNFERMGKRIYQLKINGIVKEIDQN